MDEKTDQDDGMKVLISIAQSLERIADAVENVVKVEDVGRARVYAEHLGNSLKR